VPEVLPIVISLSVTPNTEAVRQAVKLELADLIDREGMPDTLANTEVWLIYLSHIRQAISLAPGLKDYTLHAPVANIEVYPGWFPMLRDIVFDGVGPENPEPPEGPEPDGGERFQYGSSDVGKVEDLGL